MQSHMQLEALWTLINLASTDNQDNLMRILSSNLTGIENMTTEDLEDDMQYNHSQILQSINLLLTAKMS